MYREKVTDMIKRRPIYPVLDWKRAVTVARPCVSLAQNISVAVLDNIIAKRGTMKVCDYVYTGLTRALAEQLIPLAVQTKALLTLDAFEAGIDASRCSTIESTVPLNSKRTVLFISLDANRDCMTSLRLDLTGSSVILPGVYSVAMLRRVLSNEDQLMQHAIVLVF